MISLKKRLDAAANHSKCYIVINVSFKFCYKDNKIACLLCIAPDALQNKLATQQMMGGT